MARNFNGTSDFAEILSAVSTGNNCTMACWFYVADTSEHSLMEISNGINTEVFLLELFSSKVGAEAKAAGNTSEPTTSTTFSTNTWNHACAVFNGTASRSAYLNGGGKGSSTTSIVTSGFSQTDIGVHYGGGGTKAFFMKGSIAEAAVWTTALTDAEVLALANGVLPWRVRPASLVAYWPLYGLASPEVDLSGNASNLTLTGTTQIDHAPVSLLVDGITPCDIPAATASPPLPQEEFYSGPPIRGTPVIQRLPQAEGGLLVITPPAITPFRVVQTSTPASSGSASTLNTSFSAAVGTGAGIVVIGASDSLPSGVSDNKGNTYALVNTSGFFGADNTWMYYCASTVTGGGGFTVTASGLSGKANVVAVELSGSIASIDQNVTNSGNPGTCRTGRATTNSVNEIAFVVMNNAHSTAQTAPDKFTNIYDDPTIVGSECAYQILTDTQPLDALWVGSSTPFSSILATFVYGTTAVPGAQLVPPPVQEMSLGPPMRGAPWVQRLLTDTASLLVQGAPVLPFVLRQPIQETWLGPPLRGAPWVQRLPLPEGGFLITVQPKTLYEPEIYTGPPLRGAPWAVRVHPTEAGLLYIAGPQAVAPPPPPFYQEVIMGPPMRGAPWLVRVAQTESGLLVIQGAPSIVPQRAPVQEVISGPPLRGAPWTKIFVPEEIFLATGPIFVPAAIIYPPTPEVRQGPPMRGAPWVQRLPDPMEGGLLFFSPPVPIALYEIRTGPPLRGAPWMMHLPAEAAFLFGPKFPPPIPPIPGPGRGKAQPFLPRLADVSDARRLDRITQKLSAFFNSLVRQGIIQQQQGPKGEWTLRTGGFEAPRPPGAADDLTIGATPGVSWVDTSAGKVWFCVSNLRNAAVWNGPF